MLVPVMLVATTTLSGVVLVRVVGLVAVVVSRVMVLTRLQLRWMLREALGALTREPVGKLVHTLTRAGAHGNQPRVGANSPQVLEDALRADPWQMGQQINLAEDYQIRDAEHHGILERLVLSLGHTENHDVLGLPKIVNRWAYQVTDVLDEQVLRCLPIELMERAVDQSRVEVTRLPGRNGQRSNSGIAQTGTVVIRREIAAHRA